MMLFPTALFRATTFLKIDKNAIVLLMFIKNFHDSQNFPTMCFPPNERKINAGFVKFFETYAKGSDFRNFLNNIFEKSRKFLNISQQNCVFRPNARKINSLFVTLFWEIC